MLAACGSRVDDLVCAHAGCFFGKEQWQAVTALANLPDPPPDSSNVHAGNEAAIQLGWRLYFDSDLSGTASWVDPLGRATATGRAPLGSPVRIACATCHNPAHGGADTSSSPGNVSVGAGWYDVNGQQTVNAAYYPLLYWNGRIDSLWAQAAAVMESGFSLNGNRLALLWTLNDKYRARYVDVFGETSDPFPVTGDSGAVALLLADPSSRMGSCLGTPPDCPAGCRVVTNSETQHQTCHPRFPLKGKPGSKKLCQAGDSSEPFGDAFDCMDEGDQQAVTQVLINAAHAIAAYEYELRSRHSPFDRFVTEGPLSHQISDQAQRGLALFTGRASCIDCHNSPLFSDAGFHDQPPAFASPLPPSFGFHNIGVPQAGQGIPTVADCGAGQPKCDCVAGKSCLPWGQYDGLEKLQTNANRRSGPAAVSYGRYQTLVPTEAMKGAWRTPSLRDVALTAPYMHDGIYRTLEEVIDHYDRGGSPQPGQQTAPELHPLLLSARDRSDLVAFLLTLTGVPDRPELHVAPPPGGTP